MAGFKNIVVVEQIIIGGDGSEVVDEQLRYDLPETHAIPLDAVTLDAFVEESSPAPTEEGILAVLLLADESHAVMLESVTLDVEVLTETHPAATDAVSIIGSVSESHPVPADDIVGMVLVLDEVQPAAVEDVTGTQAIVTVLDTQPASTDAVWVVVEVLNESVVASSDEVTLDAAIAEAHPAASEDVTGTNAIFVIDETHPSPTDSITIGSVLAESAPASTDAATPVVSGNLWPGTVVTGTGFTNTANAVDKDTGTAAACTASSSGLGNLTSNTTNGTLVVSAPDPQLSDLTTISAATIRISTTATNTGALSGQAISMALEYSLNDGTGWTNIATITTFEGAQTRTVDVTSTIGNDWAKVNGFRLRATGSVTSGIGTAVIQSVSTFSFHYGRLELTASRAY